MKPFIHTLLELWHCTSLDSKKLAKDFCILCVTLPQSHLTSVLYSSVTGVKVNLSEMLYAEDFEIQL